MKDAVKSEWQIRPLGEVVTLNYGKALARSERNPNGSIPVYGANGVMDWSEHTLTEGPSLVIGRKGSAGEVTRVDGPFWPSDVTYYTTHDHNALDFDFLHYTLQTLNLPNMARGVKPGINRNDVYALPISLPPLEEQQRIVAVLDEALEGLARARAHAEANLQSARELFGSAMQAALQDETISWGDVTLADLGAVITGSTPKTSEKGNLGDHIPFVKPGDFMPDGSLVYDNQGLSKQGAAVSRVLPAGSALMVCIGATIGKAGYSDRPIATNQQINAVVPKDGISGEYLYYQMLTPEFQADVMRGAGQATLPIINKGKWSKLKVRMPSDLSKQAEIVDKLSKIRAQVDAASAQYQLQILDLSDLRQSLLQKAFSGELT